jgi:hypothetical protein
MSKSKIFAAIVASLLFGFSISSIEPYPSTHADTSMLIATVLFLIATALLHRSRIRFPFAAFGFVTFACYLVADIWFWFGFFYRGWWYPPTPPIVEQFFFVDGEAGYDAMRTNLFLVFWGLAFMAFVTHHLISRLKTTQQSSTL